MLAQLEGSGRGALGSYNAEAYQALADALQQGVKDGDQWVAALMRRNNSVGKPRMRTYACARKKWPTLSLAFPGL